MNGKELKDRLLKEGYKLSELSDKLGITEQNMYSKLKSKNLTIDLIKLIASVTNKSVYYWLNEPEEITNSEFERKYYGLLEKYNACLEEKDRLKSIRGAVVARDELKGE